MGLVDELGIEQHLGSLSEVHTCRCLERHYLYLIAEGSCQSSDNP